MLHRSRRVQPDLSWGCGSEWCNKNLQDLFAAQLLEDIKFEEKPFIVGMDF